MPTGVDALAISIGTAHGRNPGLPVLDFERLAEINRWIPAPLVLHGETRRVPEQIRRAVQLGIRRVNVATDLARTFAQTIAEALQEGEGFFWHGDVLVEVNQRWTTVVSEWIWTLGSKDRIVDRLGKL